MNALAVAAILSAWALGLLLVAALWPGPRRWRDDLVLVLPLGLLAGFGATSGIFFAVSLVSGRPAAVGASAECLVGVVLLTWLARRGANAPRPVVPSRSGSWLHLAVGAVFFQAVVVSLVVAWRSYIAEPFGGGDAWAIWNMHARFMLRGGTAWPDLLASPQINWSHPDYPRLVSGSVARVWGWAGNEAPCIAALISALFAAATVGVLMASVARLRGRLAALAGGLILVGTPFFVTFAANEHADIPLAAYMLAAVALALLVEGSAEARGGWALAGIFTGLAAWTKNEGLLFAVVFGAVWIGRQVRRGGRRAIGFLVLGILPALLLVGGFKLLLAPTNDLVGATVGSRLGQAFDVARHRLLLASLWRDVRAFGEWALIPFLPMLLPFLSGARVRRVAGGRLVPVVAALMLAGYYGVYLLTPMELGGHINSSLVRLLLQLWPLALLAWCLALPWTDEEVVAPPPRARFGGFIAANATVAVILVAVLSAQTTPRDLAVARSGLVEISAAFGAGWFDQERHGRDSWAWSKGRATLLVHVDTQRNGAESTLRFRLRGLARQQVTIRLGPRVLWQGEVAEKFVPVELSRVPLAAGTNALEFSTDTPGTPESTAVNARALTFAVYNFQLK
ncbi:MAG TPA: glycosyltransferase family 39 protein [Opitutaceae bacterium]|nr:glycosyltransferase family 39 protein [Opitutaceae bacterium]